MIDAINIRTAILLVEWCTQKYGPSKFANIETLTIEIDDSLIYYGEYDQEDNVIILNRKRHRSLLSWCNTIIHEYTHFTQNMTKYQEYRNSYEKHPYEITANRRSDKDMLEARRWLRKKLKQDLNQL